MSKLALLIPPAPLTILFAGLMWGLNSQTPTAWLFSVPSIISAVPFSLGLLFIIPAVISFVKAKTTVDPRVPQQSKHLVVSGLYRLSRNPMYLGMLLCLISLSLYQGNTINLAVCMLFVIYMNRFQIIHEEKALQRQFGEQYKQYCDHVRRWI